MVAGQRCVVLVSGGTGEAPVEGDSRRRPSCQEPLVNVYRVPSRAASEGADDREVPGDGLMVAFRLADVGSPLRNGRRLAAGERSALVIGGTARIRTGEATVFCKVVAVAPARIR